MIKIKSPHELKIMAEAGQIAEMARRACGEAAVPGVTTRELDHIARKVIQSYGATPSFLGYGGFPAAICCSVNDEVIHGIPGSRRLREGDLVKIDVGALYRGYHGDCAATFPCGKVSPQAEKLIQVTRQSFYEGIKFAREGYRISDISKAIEDYTVQNGFFQVRDYVGHGVGTELHEEPEVPNFVAPGKGGHGPRLVAGMTIAIEPMVNVGTFMVRQMPDGWTVKTADGSLSSHYENTILITKDEPVILTAGKDGRHA